MHYALPSTHTSTGGRDDDPGGRAPDRGAIDRFRQLARAQFADRNRQTRGRALRWSPAPGSQAHHLPGSLYVVRALTFAQLSGDKDLSARLIKRFDPLMTPAESGLVVNERHVDFSVFGVVPLEIAIETKEQKYLDMGKAIA